MVEVAVKMLELREKEPLRRSPFILEDRAAYEDWRDAKLASYPTRREDFIVEVHDLGAPTPAERDAIRRLAQLANMAVYVTRSNLADERATRHALLAFGHAFGLAAIEDHRSAEADGVVRIEVVDQGGKLGYIPYTDRPINWHTDGYYNYHGPKRAVRAMLLHCMHPAGRGGVNRLLDPEIAYIRLRDHDSRHIEALMHPEAMTIPESVEANGRVRPENVGPVFFTDIRGALGMRYTARKRNVVWRNDPETHAAVARLESVLATDPLILETRMETGQGVICNNALHDRTGFPPAQDSGEAGSCFASDTPTVSLSATHHTRTHEVINGLCQRTAHRQSEDGEFRRTRGRGRRGGAQGRDPSLHGHQTGVPGHAARLGSPARTRLLSCGDDPPMSNSVKTPLKSIAAPYGRQIRLDDVAYDSGMKLLRVTIREGARYTILEIDAPIALEWSEEMRKWAEANGVA